MHLSGVQVIIEACPGSHRGYFGWRNTLVFLFSPFFLDAGFSPLLSSVTPHVSEPRVGFSAVPSLLIQHHPCCMERAERLSASEISAKKSSKI